MQDPLVKLIRRATIVAIGATGEGNTIEDPALSQKNTSLIIFCELCGLIPPEERQDSSGVLHL